MCCLKRLPIFSRELKYVLTLFDFASKWLDTCTCKLRLLRHWDMDFIHETLTPLSSQPFSKWNWISQQSASVFFPHCLDDNLWASGKCVLLPNHQCQSTEWNSTLTCGLTSSILHPSPDSWWKANCCLHSCSWCPYLWIMCIVVSITPGLLRWDYYPGVAQVRSITFTAALCAYKSLKMTRALVQVIVSIK